jgi:transcriptional regulator with PAS, ATPase and Fis domain
MTNLPKGSGAALPKLEVEWFPGMTLEKVEKDLILSAVKKIKDRAEICKQLAIPKSFLYMRLRRYGIPVKGGDS